MKLRLLSSSVCTCRLQYSHYQGTLGSFPFNETDGTRLDENRSDCLLTRNTLNNLEPSGEMSKSTNIQVFPKWRRVL